MQAVVISSEGYVERTQGARSIIARGFLQNQVSHDVIPTMPFQY